MADEGWAPADVEQYPDDDGWGGGGYGEPDSDSGGYGYGDPYDSQEPAGYESQEPGKIRVGDWKEFDFRVVEGYVGDGWHVVTITAVHDDGTVR